MTSGDEDTLACSFKTVIHRPIPHFYLATTDNPSPQMSQAAPPPRAPSLPMTPSPLMAPPVPLSVLVLPSPPTVPAVNLPMHHRAHTDSDLLYYNQQAQPVFYPTPWYPPLPPGFVYGPPPPAFVIQQVPFRSSSADCRRTANKVNEPNVIHPERVW